MDSSMDFTDMGELDHITSANNPTNFDNSFSIGEIMEQQSTSAMNNMNSISQNMSHVAEQSSRNCIVGAIPKTTSAYVRINVCLTDVETLCQTHQFISIANT